MNKWILSANNTSPHILWNQLSDAIGYLRLGVLQTNLNESLALPYSPPPAVNYSQFGLSENTLTRPITSIEDVENISWDGLSLIDHHCHQRQRRPI